MLWTAALLITEPATLTGGVCSVTSPGHKGSLGGSLLSTDTSLESTELVSELALSSTGGIVELRLARLSWMEMATDFSELASSSAEGTETAMDCAALVDRAWRKAL